MALKHCILVPFAAIDSYEVSELRTGTDGRERMVARNSWVSCVEFDQLSLILLT